MNRVGIFLCHSTLAKLHSYDWVEAPINDEVIVQVEECIYIYKEIYKDIYIYDI